MTLGGVVDRLLRDRSSLFASIALGRDMRELAIALVLIIAGGAAVFGASVGAYRGGIQILFAAIKVPLLLLLTAAICAPTWTALRVAFGTQASLRIDLIRILVALAVIALVLAALAPFVLVPAVLGAAYHPMSLVLVGCAAVGGPIGILVLERASTEGRAALRCFAIVFVLVGMQMAWTLRPYLVRPRLETVHLVRAVEGSFLDAAFRSWSSARGQYDREAAPLPGEDEGPTWR